MDDHKADIRQIEECETYKLFHVSVTSSAPGAQGHIKFILSSAFWALERPEMK